VRRTAQVSAIEHVEFDRILRSFAIDACVLPSFLVLKTYFSKSFQSSFLLFSFCGALFLRRFPTIRRLKLRV